MAQLGFRTFDEMIGRVDRLDFRQAVEHWKANGLDLSQILFEPALQRRRAAPRGDDAGSWAGEGARSSVDREGEAGARAARAGRVRAADPQRQPHGRHDARLSGDEAVGRRGPARRQHQDQLHRQRRPELRRVRAARRDAAPRRRRQRLRRQGPVGRTDCGLSAEELDVRAGREHPDRQRGALRRDQRRGVLPRRGGRAVRGPQQRRRTRWSRASAITAANT